MLSAAEAGATVAAPTPNVIAVAATAPASFVMFILTPLVRMGLYSEPYPRKRVGNAKPRLLLDRARRRDDDFRSRRSAWLGRGRTFAATLPNTADTAAVNMSGLQGVKAAREVGLFLE
jgi:hypothetical protein